MLSSSDIVFSIPSKRLSTSHPVSTRAQYSPDSYQFTGRTVTCPGAILIQRENLVVYRGRESRKRRNHYIGGETSAHRPRRSARPHAGTIGQSRDSTADRSRHPCCRQTVGADHRYSRIPDGIRITGAWHSQHTIGVQTRGSQTSRSGACRRKNPPFRSGNIGVISECYDRDDIADRRFTNVPVYGERSMFPAGRVTPRPNPCVILG
jgi:hypothetical protein